MTASIEILGMPPFDARIRDVSSGGCKISSTRALQENEIILLTIPVLGAMIAHVVWSDKGYCGLRFATPIDADRLVGRNSPAYQFAPSNPVPLEHWSAPVIH